ATPEEQVVDELSAGVYCFASDWLWEHIGTLPPNAPKKQYYLTDLIAAAAAEGQRVEVITTGDPQEALGINTRSHLAEAEAVLRSRINEHWMVEGVTILDPATTYIASDATIGPDTTILPNTHLRGTTSIGRSCHIGPNAIVVDCQIGDRCRVVASVLEHAVMEDGSDVGPFGHLRQGAHLGKGAHVGNFGEIKESTLGPGAKMGHFGYLGDAEIGARANIGAGTITCNYDGKEKHKTVVEEDAFIGSDTMLVAPVRVGKGARTGAGAVVTRDVPDGKTACGVPARVVGGDNDEDGDDNGD
ncbi:MAG: bifunctional UDP-N-acetylglucosamine diphosphorylase/glucosamine-1-phosphate N-acetyltransferase GlmU, partial [Anaerolineales bacterium]